MAADIEKLKKLARKELDPDLEKQLPEDAGEVHYQLALDTQAVRLLKKIQELQAPMAERIRHIR